MPPPLKLRYERKGRSGGSGVTVVEGFQGDPRTLDKTLSELKKSLGTGGTRKGRILELQGDVRERLRVELGRRGHTVRG